MRVQKFFILIFLSNALIFCSSKINPVFDTNEIEQLSQDNSEIPSEYEFCNFYAKATHNNFVKLQFKELKEIYQEEFYDLDYKEFYSNC